MAGRSPISLLVDASGNIVGIVSDGGVYRLQTQTKLRNPGDTADMGDATTPVRVDPTGTTTQPVSAASLPLPTGAATEATLATLATEAKLEAVRVLLASLDGKDYATETTLASIDGKDFATQTTLATLATEAKLEAVRILLASLDGKDFATETTLAAADSKLGTIDADTGQLVTDLQELLTRFGDDIASPAADTLLARIQELIDNLGSGASPVADTLQARIQELIDSLGTAVPSPTADTVQARLQEAIDLLTTIDTDTSNLDVALSTRATEDTLDAIRDNIGEGVTTPTADTLMARVQEMIDLLTSIKDTDGVQIIDDIIRLGDLDRNGINSVVSNLIRRLEARSSITSPDGSTDVAVITDNSINRLESRSTVTGQIGGIGSEVKVTVIEDIEEPTEKRFQTEARLAPGSTVNIGTSIPSDPAALEIGFLENGGSEDMLVNGSGTPVTFSFTPLTGKTVAVQDVLVVFTADDFEFDGSSFGPNAALSNGILVQLYIGGVATDIFTIKQNEDFLRIPGRLPLVNNTGPKDVLSSAFSFGGLVKLSEPAGDEVRVFIRDDLTSVKLKYLTFTLYGVDE